MVPTDPDELPIGDNAARMHLFAILERAVALFGDHVATVDATTGATATYREVAADAARIARCCFDLGVRTGDRIAILARNQPTYLAFYFAAAQLDAIAVPLNHRLARPELDAILADAECRIVLADPAFQDLVDRPQASPHRRVLRLPDAITGEPLFDHPPPSLGRPFSSPIAHLYYTSGTTGESKGVMLTHDNVAHHALAAIAELQLTDGDVWAHCAPMFHLADAWATFAVTWVGGRHVFFPEFDAEETLTDLAHFGVTATNLVPTMLNRLDAAQADARLPLPELRLLMSGGAPATPELVRRIQTHFPQSEYVQTYGMTETSPYLTLSLLEQHHRRLPLEQQLAIRATTGRPFLSVELILVDDQGILVPKDEHTVGEIWVRGPTVTPGYWRKPGATQEAFCEHWLRTGDLATWNIESYVTIVDRKKDVILSGGESIYTVEIEAAVARHPAVLESAAYGVPDEEWGEVPHLAVALRQEQSIEPAELQQFLAEHLARYKIPKVVRIVAALPRLGSGKVAKRLLRPS